MPAAAEFASPSPALWNALGWTPDTVQEAQLLALQAELQAWNARLNLTRLVAGEDFWITQVFDSLWPLQPQLRQAPTRPLRCIDVGTGGGFPGLALAIAMPQLRLTLVDSVGRKVEAVRAMATSLDLGDRIEVRCERAERTGRDPRCRGQYDWAVARAVASAPVVAEYLVPLLRPEGRALLYRGQWSSADGDAFSRALTHLKARLAAVRRLELPGGRGVRHALEVEALGPCPQAYPRPVGVPTKQPLA